MHFIRIHQTKKLWSSTFHVLSGEVQRPVACLDTARLSLGETQTLETEKIMAILNSLVGFSRGCVLGIRSQKIVQYCT